MKCRQVNTKPPRKQQGMVDKLMKCIFNTTTSFFTETPKKLHDTLIKHTLIKQFVKPSFQSDSQHLANKENQEDEPKPC